MRLSIIIPCFNEAETIEAVVARVRTVALPDQWEREIIVVDDGSAEPTKQALARIEKSGEPITILHREKNGGKGAAVKDGMRVSSGEYLIIQDADMEYNPDEFGSLLQPIVDRETDTVFGSRSLGKNNVRFSAIYYYGGLLVTQVYNVLFWTRLTDIASCYKVFHRRHVPELLRSSHDDFVFDAVDLTHTLVHEGGIVEVPISYTARSKRTGKKLNWKHGLDIVVAIFLTRLGVPIHHRSGASKIVRFLVAGVTATVVNILALALFTELFGIWYAVSSALAFVCAFGVSFTMQKYWAFRNADLERVRSQLPMHLTVALINLVINVALVIVFVEYMHMWYLLAQIVASAIISIESFFAFRWIYR